MIGEIGGDAEERAAAYIARATCTKPVVGYVAGFTAPEGKTMGHAGAIVSGSSGTAQAKKEALEAAGVQGRQDAERDRAADARAAHWRLNRWPALARTSDDAVAPPIPARSGPVTFSARPKGNASRCRYRAHLRGFQETLTGDPRGRQR